MKPVLCAVLLFSVWMLATWLLEGRIETLQRPEAVADRTLYALIANIVIGVIGGMVVLALLLKWQAITPATAGFASWRRSAAAMVAGTALGLPYYLLAGGSFADVTLLANVFAQVLAVSAAEVVVCWSVVGSVTRSTLARITPRGATILAGVISGAAFGIYHFAHSAPFNSLGTVAFLSMAGLVTSGFFFISRDLLGTLTFHNFPAAAGVTQALLATGELPPGDRLQTSLITVAALALVTLVAGQSLVSRRFRQARRERQ